MTVDPIVDEIHQARRRIWEECCGDVERLIARLREAEAKDKDRLVTLEDVRRRAGGRQTAAGG
jgi:hypothetical protein